MMNKHSFCLQVTFPVSPQLLYSAWLNAASHSAMTGGEAYCTDQISEEFSAWDGYITGKNLRFEPNKVIIQSWRTMDFQEADPDSQLELQFQSHDQGCKLTLIHTEIPDGQPDYKQGWEDHYFAPMRSFFST